MSPCKVKRLSFKQIHSDPKMYNRLRFLTNGGWGRICSRMHDMLEDQDPLTAWAAYSPTGEIIGWTCISDDLDFDGHPGKVLDVYVGAQYRRQGVGTKLMKAAIKHADKKGMKVLVTPWDHKSTRFYYSVREQVVWDGRCL